MKTMRQTNGFTLIELLIVVAIIAILALIAVPNFLEAQTRAKVSRVRSDLRSLAVAEEAYRVDWNTFTHLDMGDDPTYIEGFCELTTPVAYITSLPKDAFGEHRYAPNLTRRDPMYELGTGVAGVSSAGTPQSSNATGFPADAFLLTSAGPDHRDDTCNPHEGFNLTEGQFPWPSLPNNDQAVAAVSSLAYDPTNGTVSGGQVYRTGGTTLPGRPGQVLAANSSGAK
jgi:prepilin-type N-terminal cleavage/methylation domain-containing protein